MSTYFYRRDAETQRPLSPLCASAPLHLCVENFYRKDAETQRPLSPLRASAPLRLCVETQEQRP